MNSAKTIETAEMQTPVEGRRGISGSTVKIIAVVTMLIDHAAATVLARYLVMGVDTAIATGDIRLWLEENAAYYTVYNVMRGIGRLGFPIFCFLLVEGYQRTRDVKKYALRLFLFALLSDVPFDLAISGQPIHWGYQNVYFTLLLGLLALCAFGFFEKREGQPQKDLPLAVRILFMVTGVFTPILYADPYIKAIGEDEKRTMACAILMGATIGFYSLYGWRKGLRRLQTVCADMTALLLCMKAAELLCTDYGGMGVLTIAVMYLFRRRKALAMGMGCVVLTIMSLSEVPAFLAVIPVALYNGKRGLKMKYFFYAFYPVHLLLLYLLAVLLGLGAAQMV